MMFIRAIVITLIGMVCSPAAAQDGNIQWYKDLRQAISAARQSNKPSMIEF